MTKTERTKYTKNTKMRFTQQYQPISSIYSTQLSQAQARIKLCHTF